MNLKPKNILISGASSGIGRALAICYAQKDVNLFLCGRNLEKLEKTQKICNALGANIFIKAFDIKDIDSINRWVEEVYAKYDIDLVVANAGISAGTSLGSESFEQVKEIFDVNLYGVINLIQPVIEKMKQRKNGQIAIISSLAGFRGLPSSPAYSASKAAVRVYGEALRGNLAQFGIKVNVVCPGYVKTPMTDVNDFPMPFIISSTKCAQIIKNGLAKNKSRIAFPWPLYFVVWFATLISNKITDPIFARLPSKKSL